MLDLGLMIPALPKIPRAAISDFAAYIRNASEISCRGDHPKQCHHADRRCLWRPLPPISRPRYPNKRWTTYYFRLPRWKGSRGTEAGIGKMPVSDVQYASARRSWSCIHER